MTRGENVRDSTEALSTIPRGALPPFGVRDLPEAVPFRKMIGPSIMLTGLALGSGEFILWPYITYASGFVFFWACVLGVTTQYFLNMEVTRYTLATGESAITGFARLSKHWAWIFLILNVVPWMIPAWAKGAAQLFSWLLFPDHDAAGTAFSPYVTVFTIVGLFGCGVILTLGKVVYETVERIQLVLVSVIMILVAVLAVWVVRGDAIIAQFQGAINIGGIPEFSDQLTAAVLLGAIAFAGVGGTLNLGQSNYVKDKGYGMGRFIGRITSPISSESEAVSELGYSFPLSRGNLDRWKRWWKAASLEHFLSFFVTCLVCLVLLTLISYSLFYETDGSPRPERGQYAQGMGFVWGQAIQLDSLIGPGIKILFLAMGVVILLTTEFGLLDAASRISSDIVKVNWLRESSRWSGGRLYYGFLWGTILLSSLFLVVGMEKVGAFALFKFTAAMNGGVMFIYSALLLYLNRFRLPRPLRMSGWRALIMIWAVLFFGFFAVWAVWYAF